MGKKYIVLAVIAFLLFITISLTYETNFFTKIDEAAADTFFGNDYLALFHYIGETIFVVIVTAILMLVIWLKHQNYRLLLFVVLTMAAGTAINQGLKAFFARPRPELVDQLTSYSFPSGHSMMGILYLLTIAYVITELSNTNKRKVMIWSVAIILFILIGLSRVAGGRHFATDVLGGWSLGFAWFVLCVYWYEGRKRAFKSLKK